MNNKNKPKASAFPLVLSVLFSLLVAAGGHASIYMIIRSMRADIETGAVAGLGEKLTTMDIVAALCSAALVILFICVQIINFNLYIKPLHKMKIVSGHLLKAGGDVMGSVDALHNELKRLGNAADQAHKLAGEHSVALAEASGGAPKLAATARQLFADSASVDNEIAMLAKTIDEHSSGARAEILRVIESSREWEAAVATEAAAVAEAAEAAEAAAVVEAAEAAEAAAVTEAVAVAEDEKNEGGGAYRIHRIDYAEFIDEADSYLHLLAQLSKDISAKIAACTASIKTAESHANRVSLDAAIASAKAGLEGRGFAYIAEDIRSHAEDMRKIVSSIGEASGQTDAQAVLVDELVTLYIEAGRNAQKPSYTEEVVPEEDIVQEPVIPPTVEQIILQANSVSAPKTDVAPSINTSEGSLDSVNSAADAADIANAVDVADAADGSLNPASEATDTADGTLSPAADTADGSPHIAEDAPPFDMDAWDAQCATIKSGQDALRVAIRSVGASLAKISDAAASDVKR
ncbi:MAG: hypothetical protein FWH01_14870, partial [Oscillospiraceae bacterium]|nr:hypothetical protein [Oscillospiraceae bacterium]